MWWETQTGKRLHSVEVDPNYDSDNEILAVFSVAFSPDGKTIVSAGEKTLLKLWDAATGRELRSLKGHTGDVYCVAFSPDGKTIASCSD
jgi:WD40 repeat protein